MKNKWTKRIITIFVLYAVFINSIYGFFELLNKDSNHRLWISILETDLPNFISILSMIYLLFLINKRNRDNG